MLLKNLWWRCPFKYIKKNMFQCCDETEDLWKQPAVQHLQTVQHAVQGVQRWAIATQQSTITVKTAENRLKYHDAVLENTKSLWCQWLIYRLNLCHGGVLIVFQSRYYNKVQYSPQLSLYRQMFWALAWAMGFVGGGRVGHCWVQTLLLQ